ncbi:MAG: lipoyl(octanoyl) transferase LipB [bacterium]
MDAVIKDLGEQDYFLCWQAMRNFTRQRIENTPDEIWLVEHFPVYTQGQAGKAEHILNAGEIPIVQTDRGGQVTYHGPGQLVIYPLINLKRRGIGIKAFVNLIEQSIIDFLAGCDIDASRKDNAPGVYVNEAKIAALGLRVHKGCCYHGLAINVDTDLEPFSRINPCGYADMPVTSLKKLGCNLSIQESAEQLLNKLSENL